MTRDPFDYDAPSIDDETTPTRRVPLPARAAPAAEPAPAGDKPDLRQLVDFAASRFDVDPHVLAGMVMKESMLRDDVISGQRKSSAGAVGIAQFMPDTAKRYGVDPTDPTQSVIGMAAYLRDNLVKFNGDYRKAIAGYNWGENRKALDGRDWESSAPAETRDYVDFVTKFAESLGGPKPALARDLGPDQSDAETARLARQNARALTGLSNAEDEPIYDPMTGVQIGTSPARQGEAPSAGRGLVSQAIDPQIAVQNRDLNLGAGQLLKDLKGSAKQTAGLGASAGAFAGAVDYRAARATMADLDFVDAGRVPTATAAPVMRPSGGPPSMGEPNAVVRQYQSGTPEQRAALRQSLVSSMQRDTGFVHDALQAKKDYEAEALKQFGGKILDFTDVRTATGFANWAVRTGVANSTTMAATMLAAFVGGVPGLAAASTVMAAGDINSGRAEYADQVFDPKRFTSADRAADAAAQRDERTVNYLADKAPQTAALIPGYVAADLIPGMGPAARAARPVAAGVEKLGARAFVKHEAKELGREVVGEAINEGPIQEGTNLTSDILAGERPADLTTEDAKRILNAAAAGAAMAPAGTAGNIAREGFHNLREPAPAGGDIGAPAELSQRFDPTPRGATNFTEPDSASALAGLTPIIVPHAAPAAQNVAATDALDAEGIAPSLSRATPLDEAPEVPQTTAAEARLRELLAAQKDRETAAAAPLPATQEDQLRDRLAARLGITPNTGDAAPAAAKAAAPPALDSEPRAADIGSAPHAGLPDLAATSARDAAASDGRPAQTWLGRSGAGYTTQMDAEQAIAGRAQRHPDLDWRVERVGDGRFALNGYRGEWTSLPASTGTLGIPRADMPQIDSQHHGALVNFLNARGITHESVEVAPNSIRPTQDRISQAKVQAIKQAGTGDRSVLISSDNYILDGHHQALAALQSDRPVRAIRLNSPIKQLLVQAKAFPSASRESASATPDAPLESAAARPQQPGLTAAADQLMTASAGAPVAASAAPTPAAPTTSEAPAVQHGALSKIFSTRKDATVARQALGNTHRLQRAPGGYKLRAATDKELAASARSGQRLKRSGSRVNVDTDSLLTAIAKNGGLSMAEKADTVRDPRANKNAGGNMVFTNRGHAIDQMAQRLYEDGYVPEHEMEADGGVRWLQGAVADEFAGLRRHHSTSGEAWMRNARDEALGDSPDYDAAGISDEHLERAGYFADTDGVRAAMDAITAAATEAEVAGNTDAAQRFWQELNDLEQHEERHAIQHEEDTAAVDTEDGARARNGEGAATRGSQAGHSEGAQDARQEAAPVNLTARRKLGADDAHDDELSFSTRGSADDTAEQAALHTLSQSDELFALPKSESDTVEGIAADNDPGIKVRESKVGTETMYTLAMPNSANALLWVRPAPTYGPHAYGSEQNANGDYEWDTTRPGENPEDVPQDTEEVFLDVSRLKAGDEGRMAYNIAATFAHNTGRIFIGDPSGLSDIALRRRSEQMLSSALKFGTTRHLAPHPRQARGNASIGVPPLKWVYGDDLGNITRLIEVNLSALENTGHDNPISFDPRRGLRSAGEPVTVEQLLPRQLRGAGASQAGGHSLARAAVLRALLREESSGGEGEERGRNGLLARLVRQQSIHDGALNGLFYSRRQDAYQHDPFGDSLPDLFGARADRPSGEAANDRSVDAAAGVPAGRYASTTALVTTSQQQLGHSGPVRTAAGAAAALGYLSRSSVERFDALVTDAAGEPLAVIGGFKGALSQTAVYPATLMGEAIGIDGAANLWLVHNHPSGGAALSRADLALQKEVARVFDGTSIAVRDIIAVTHDEFAAGADGSEHVSNAKLPARQAGATVPRQEREITATDKLAPAITAPADARQAAREIAAANGDRPGLMLLDSQNRPIAYVPWEPADALPLKGNGKLDALFRAVSHSNAGAAMIVDPHGRYSLEQVNNLAGALKAVDVRPLDAIQSGRSLTEAGVLAPKTAFQSRGRRQPAGLASADELGQALKTAFPALGKAFDKMLARGESGAKGGLVALDTASTAEIARVLAEKTGRSLEQARTLLAHDGAAQTFQSEDGDTQGFYDPKSGLTFVLLPNVTAATAPGVVLHEVTHSQQRADIDKRALKLIENRTSPGHSKETRNFLDRVAQRMQDAGEAANLKEATAYLVEQAVIDGRQEGFSAADGKFLAWVEATFGKAVGGVIRDFLASVRSWGLRYGVDIRPTVDDLVAYAKASVHAAAAGDVISSGGAAQTSSRADQTLTPAFRRWFGDSKAVDASGKPLVVHHGTTADRFTVFNTRGAGEHMGNTGYFGNGAYFAEERSMARNYGRNVEAAYLSIQKPFEWDDSKGATATRAVVDRLLALPGVTDAEKLRAQKLFVEIERDKPQEQEHEQAPTQSLAEALAEADSMTEGMSRKMRETMRAAAERAFHDQPTPKPTLRDTITASRAADTIFAAGRHERTRANMTGDRMRDLMESAGFDGVITSNAEGEPGATEYVAFHPEQIKSATDNVGSFDPADPDIRFSMKGDDGADMTPPSESFARKVQRFGQDAMNRFTVIKNWAETNGVKLSDDADVWSFEERMHGRMASRLQDFREKTVKPLVNNIQAAGFTMAEVGAYLHHQHAEERNAQIAKLDPSFKDGSGIATAAARQYLAAVDPKLAAVANEFRAITQSTLKVLLDAGIINTDMTRAFAGAYEHYVPLRGSGDKAAPGEPGTRNQTTKPGKGNSVDGDIDRATGRSGGVDPYVVENILRAHESAIVQAEKNILGHSLLAFVMEIANPEVATIGEPEKRSAVKLGYQFEVTDDSTSNPTVYRTFDSDADAYAWMGQQPGRGDMRVRKTIANQQVDAQVGKLNDNEVKVYVAGHAIKVQLNDPLLSRAYQKLGIEKLPVYLAMSRDINRFLSKAYTGWNPEFSVVNPVRDFTTGVINITGKFGAAASAKAVAKYPKALAQLMRYAYTGKSSASIDAYRAAGGSTGAAYLGDIERIGADIEQSYNEYVGATRLAADGKPGAAAGVASRKLVGALTGWIEGLNQATENAFRLAVFEALKSEHGINKAASAAKNSTVNFNRRGELGGALGAMYLFFNPTAQGTAAMMSAVVHGDHRWQARALVAGLVGAAYLLAATQYGDDDDDEFKKIPGFVKDRSLIIRLPAGRYITIPIPYGYAFAVTAGNALYSAMHGGDADTLSMSIASSILDNFSPVGNPLSGANHWHEAAPKGLLELLPGAPFGDLTKDAVRVISNRSGLGHQIVPESHFDEGKPDHLRLNRATKGSVFDKAAHALSDATGGTQTQAGGIDVSPETLRFWTNAVTGGTGAFIADTARLGELGARKLAGEEGDLSPELKEIPIVRRFARDSDIRDSRSAYWDAANEAKAASQDRSRAKKAHDDAGMDKVEAESQAQLEAARSFIRYNRQIKRLRNEVDEIAQDDSVALGMKRIRIKELEAQEKALYDGALQAQKRVTQ